MPKPKRIIVDLAAIAFTLSITCIILYTVLSSTNLSINEKFFYSILTIPISLSVLSAFYLAPRAFYYIYNVITRYTMIYKLAPVRLGPLRVNNLGALVVAIVSYASMLILLIAHHIIPAIILITQGLIFTYMAFFRKSYVKLEVARNIKTPWYVWLPRIHPRLTEYSMKISSKLKGLLEESGTVRPPIYFGSLIVSLIIISMPLTLLLFYLIGVYGLAVLVQPVIPVLYLFLKRKARYEEVIKQLPFFTFVVELFHIAGANIVHVFEEGLAPVREVLVYKRLRSLYGLDPLSALRRLAKQHRNEFGEYINGYVDVALSGGDVQAYVSDKAREYLSRLSDDWLIYAEEAGGIAETLFIVFVLGPILILSSSFFGTQSFLTVYNFFIPIMGVLGLVVVSSMAPSYRLYINDKTALKAGLAATAIALTASYILDLPTWMKTGLTIAAFIAAYGFTVRIQLYEAWGEEKQLPHLVRSLLERIRAGYPFNKALEEVNIDTYKAKIQLYLRTGRLPGFRSSIVEYVFRLLDIARKLGTTTPETLQKILFFTETILEAKRKASKRLTRYEMLAFMSPFILSSIPYIIASILSKFAEIRLPGLGFTFTYTFNEDEMNISVILSATMLSLLLAKTKSMTLRDVLKPLVIIVLTIFSLHVIPPLVSSIW